MIRNERVGTDVRVGINRGSAVPRCVTRGYSPVTWLPGTRRLLGRELWRWQERCANDAYGHEDATGLHHRPHLRLGVKGPHGRRSRMTRDASAVESTILGAGEGRGPLFPRTLTRHLRHFCAHRRYAGATGHHGRARPECGIEQRLETTAAETPEGEQRGHRSEGAREGIGVAHRNKLLSVARVRLPVRETLAWRMNWFGSRGNCRDIRRPAAEVRMLQFIL
jgi:hypothetical protein